MKARPQLRHFEDFAVGEVGELGEKLVTADEIIAFAREFDPQPFHLDEAAGRKSLLGGLAASGWHTCCMLMRLICDGYLGQTAGLGSPGIEEVAWLKPVLAGDVLRARYEVKEARPSASRPGVGILRVRYQVRNQNEQPVMTWNCIQFVAMHAKPDAARSKRRPSGATKSTRS